MGQIWMQIPRFSGSLLDAIQHVLIGEVSPDVGASLLSAMTSVLRAIEVEELAKRIEALEEAKN